MPSINRIRLVNIQYDKGGKQYADELFKLHGKNTLLNLANGGGKTLWLQLVMQTQLPGAILGNRKMVDLLAHERYTGHILVEWKLDTFGEREFLLTGFCFTKSAEDEGDLKYFTYAYPYKIADEFGIAKLPLVQDGRVLSYGDLHNLLRREANGRRIQTFSQYDRRKYIQHLAQYHIYEKEWFSIRTTNGSEGGMDGFFSRSKTEQSLLENLLIPTVDQALFQDEKEAQDLANSFLKYKDKLLRIPQIEKNLEEFEEIEEAGRSVVDKVAAYSESQRQRVAHEGHLVTVKGRLGEMVIERADEADALEEIVAALDQQIREEEYKQASLDVNLLQADYREAGKKIESLQGKKADLVRDEEEAERSVRLHRAVPKHLQIKEFEKRLARDQETLSGLDMLNEDILTEQKQYQGQFLTLWQERRNLLEADLAAKNEEREKWKGVEAEAERELANLSTDLNKLSKKGGEIELWFKQYEKQKAAVRDLLGEGVAEEPAAERDNLRWQEIEATNGVREMEAQVEAWDDEVAKTQKEVEAERDNLRVAKLEQEKLENSMAEFEQFRSKMAERLALLDLARSDLHGSRAELELRLTEKREGYAREFNKYAAKKGALEEKRELLTGADYYVPSQDLLQFQQVLADWGIDSILGSQWLQEREPSERESLVRGNPLLPYALLLTDNDIRKLHDPRLDWEGVYMESLIPLLSLTAVEQTAATTGDGQIIALPGDTVYLSMHGGYTPFLSPAALDKRRSGLDAEMVTVVETMDIVEKSRRHIEQVADALAAFFDKYKNDPSTGWETKRQSLILKVAGINERIVELTGQVEDLRKQISEAKKGIKERNEQLEGLREKLRVLDPLANLYAERKDKEAARREQQERESELAAEQDKWTHARMEAREQDDRLMPLVYSVETEVAGLQRQREKYLGSAAVEIIAADPGLTYDAVCGKLDSLSDLLADKSVGRDELVRLIQNHEESIRQNLAYIQEQGVSPEELAQFQSAPPASELTFWENRLKEARDDSKRVEKELSDLSADQKKIEGMIETEEKKVKKDFSRAPYSFSEEIDLAGEKERLKETLATLVTQRETNEKALDEVHKGHEEAKTLLQKVETLISAYSIECEAMELPEDRAKKLESEPSAVVAELDKGLSKSTKATEERRREMEDEFYRFERSIDKYESKIVQKFIRSVIDSKSEGDMSDIEQVRPVFEKCFEMMKLYIEKAHLERQELEEAKEELVHRSLQHADRVYENLKSIAQYTKIDYRGKKVQAIEIQLKEKWENPAGLKLMSQYLHALTEELQAKVAKGEDEDDIEKWLTIKLSSKHLLNVVAPVGEARIKVFKPQQVPGEKLRYDHWSEIMKWSGGEQYTGCFAMFIAVLSYLRSKMSGIDNASKVLLADNPFGVVSSPHLLQVIFKLAQANRVQMICLSDHNKQSIYDLFEVVYSLKLVPTLGRSVIQSSERRPESLMEAGFYEIDFDQEVETEQKSLPI